MLRSDRILSQPCKVLMAGFESNTYLLQSQGWELSMQEDFQYCSVRMIMRHNVWKTYAVSSPVSHEFFAEARMPPVFNIVMMASRLEAVVTEDFSKYRPIDATPEIAFLEKRQSIEDFRLFKTVDHSQDIIVDPNDVAALMEHILKIQSPKQAEIREKLRREKAREGMLMDLQPKAPEVMHAQIITLRGAA